MVGQRRLRREADRRGARAARRKGATHRTLGGRRHHALDGRQAQISRRAQARYRRQQALRVRVLRGRVQLAHGRAFDDAAGIHHGHAVTELGHHAEVVRDHQDAHAQLVAQAAQQVEDLRLQRHVERGGRLVGHQQLRLADQRHRDQHALAQAAREFVRVLRQPPLGRVDADALEHVHHGVVRLGRADAAVQAQRLVQLRADRAGRIQAGQRILKHHADAVAPDGAQLRRRLRRQVELAQPQPPALAVARRRGLQADRRQGGDRLAAARFADQAERLAGGDRERDAVDDANAARLATEAHRQVVDREQRRRGFGSCAQAPIIRTPRAENRTKRSSSACRRSR